MWEFPKIRSRNLDPKVMGLLLKNTHKKDPQFIEAATWSLWEGAESHLAAARALPFSSVATQAAKGERPF